MCSRRSLSRGRLGGFIRQWKLLLALDAHALGITLADAAAAHRVTERTIRRDFDTLICAGFPIESVMKPHGTWFVLRRAEWRGGTGTIFPLHSNENR